MTNPEVLYEDERLRVTYLPRVDLHNLVIDGDYLITLDRGVLEELAKTSFTELRRKLDTIDPSFIHYQWLKGPPLSSERIGYAISQARIKELEDELHAAYRS